MNEIGWFYKAAAAPGAYKAEGPEIELKFSAKHLKIRTATDLTISFDGKTDHLKVLAADGLVPFEDVNKGKLWLKGTGNYELIAWDGN